MKKILAIILCLAALFALCACGDTAKHTVGGFSIKLPGTFEKSEQERYDLYLRDGDVFVWVIKDDFSAEDGMELWTATSYLTVLSDMNGFESSTPVTEENGIVYFEYSARNEAKEKTFTYFSTAFKARDAFYMAQFVCEDAEYEAYKPQFMEWAKTVKVK